MISSSKAMQAFYFAIAIVVSACLAVSALAEDKAPPKKKDGAAASGWSAEVAGSSTDGISLDPRQVELIKKASDYFGKLDSLQGRFRQTGADGKVMKGKFWLVQNGKFRFDYARPSLQVIVSDGRYLAIQDHDLNTEDRVELNRTPFRVLLKKDVDLIRDARILEVQETDEVFLLTVADKSPEAEGRIKLLFDLKPGFELGEWVTTDPQGLETRVEVGNLVKGEKIAAKKFEIQTLWRNELGPN